MQPDNFLVDGRNFSGVAEKKFGDNCLRNYAYRKMVAVKMVFIKVLGWEIGKDPGPP